MGAPRRACPQPEHGPVRTDSVSALSEQGADWLKCSQTGRTPVRRARYNLGVRTRKREGERLTAESRRPGDERVVTFVRPQHTTRMGG